MYRKRKKSEDPDPDTDPHDDLDYVPSSQEEDIGSETCTNDGTISVSKVSL